MTRHHSKRSKFVSLLMKRFIIIESCALVIIMLLYLGITIPQSIRSSLSGCESTAEIITSQFDYTIAEVINVCEGLNNSISVSQAIKKYAGSGENMYKEQLSLILNNYAYSNNVRAVAIEIPDIGRVNSITSIYEEDEAYLESPAYQRVLKTSNLSTFSNIYNFSYGDQNDLVELSTLAYSKNYVINNITCTITIYYDITDMLSVINSVSGQSFDEYTVLNTNDEPVYAKGDTSYVQKAQEFISAHPGTNTNEFSEDGYFTVDFQGVRSWKFVGYISLTSILSAFISEQLISFLLVITTLFLTIFIFIVPSMVRAMHPVNDLTNAMEEFGSGNLKTHAIKQRDDEIGELIDVFNNLTDQINTQISDIKEYQKLQEKSRYSFLISQLDPHFLYNAMNLVSALVRQERKNDAIELNNALIEITRDRLRIRDTEVLDSVKQEISVVNQYLKIAKYMYMNSVHIIWNIDEELELALIPKNILQPIIENSLIHGLIDKETGEIRGKISIDIIREENSCIILVSDNGAGMSPKALARFNSEEIGTTHASERGKHIALRNIKNRLKYISNGQNCMFISSFPGAGTTVKFVFPLVYEI